MQIKINTNAKEIAKRVKKQGKELSDSVKKALSITLKLALILLKIEPVKALAIKEDSSLTMQRMQHLERVRVEVVYLIYSLQVRC